MNKLGKLISIAVLLFVALMSKAQTTQTLFLSGNGDGNNLPDRTADVGGR